MKLSLDIWNTPEVTPETVVPTRDEPLGTKKKEWVRFKELEIEGDGGKNTHLWLCKSVERHNDDPSRYRGEDWAEWMAQHVAELMGLPHARIIPGVQDGRRVVLSEMVLHPDMGESLHMGNSLLLGVAPGFDPWAKFQREHYTLQNVKEALHGTTSTKSPSPFPFEDGFSMWAAFLVFDALVSGGDRHLENWGIVQAADSRWMAPSYDHGNALGYQERAHRWEEMVEDPARLNAWVRRGRQKYMRGRPTLVSVAVGAVAMGGAAQMRYWTHLLASLDLPSLRPIIETVPVEVMSQACKSFVQRLLEANRVRLLEELRSREGD